MDQIISGVRGIDVNLSPDAFHMWAEHYYKCKQDFQVPGRFSPVPYFLLCRAVELELKSRHLHEKDQRQVKNEFGHDLLKAYEALPEEQKVLSAAELDTLTVANDIYKGKGFEYFKPEHALRGYSPFPKIDALDAVAAKVMARPPNDRRHIKMADETRRNASNSSWDLSQERR